MNSRLSALASDQWHSSCMHLNWSYNMLSEKMDLVFPKIVQNGIFHAKSCSGQCPLVLDWLHFVK